MREFLIKLTIFSIPFLLLLGGYFAFDPFRVIYDYDSYSEDNPVIPNRDYVSTEMFKKNIERYGYNSFIFGSSRTMGFRTKTWVKYIGNGASPFVYDAHAETIYGIYQKVKYIDEKGADIKNAIVLVCQDVTFAQTGDSQGHLQKKHPDITGSSVWDFHLEFIKSYFDVKFLFSYYLHKFSGKYRSFMNGYIEPREIRYDPVTNDVTIVDQEFEINNNPQEYYSKRVGIFERKNSIDLYPPPIIQESHVEMMKEMRLIFDKHETNYVVIVSPLYSQKYFNEKDLGLLQEVFGEDRVFDYSGENQFTENYENYYEKSHFRPLVGEIILEEVYGKLSKAKTDE